MKMLSSLCLHFARQDWQDGIKIMQLKVQNTNNQEMKIWDERNTDLQKHEGLKQMPFKFLPALQRTVVQ